MIVYIAGPYSQWGDRAENVRRAQDAMLVLWVNGIVGLAPFVATDFMADLLPYEDFMRLDFCLLDRCDAILMLPDWQLSGGAVREQARAVQRKMPVFYSVEMLLAARRLGIVT